MNPPMPRPTTPTLGKLAAASAPRSRPPSGVARRFPIGAELQPNGGAHFRVWSPASRNVTVELFAADDPKRSTAFPLDAEPAGYFSGFMGEARAGAYYKLRLDSGTFPDPASRFQPQGPHGASELVDPAFAWTDHGWRGRGPEELVIYELHLGTFTPEGTWRAAWEQLPRLAELGITALEIMPIADFPGDFGWGYDGVDLFAPSRLYGSPADAKAFIDRAHALGLMVLLDVVYNHTGPNGCFLREFSPDYFSRRYTGEWGDPLNFDDENSGPVREFFTTNARYWIEEFHFDGLRLDATQGMFDASPTHIIAEISAAAQDAARSRRLFLVGENEPQHARLLRERTRGGCELDALWNDDFHHTAVARATGRSECYYIDYRGAPQEFVSAIKYGYLFQGQWSRWQVKRRGTPALDLPPRRFVHFLQNHDQVANSLDGRRLHQLAHPGDYRALTALLLLGPAIPLLFQGQEFGASTPFLYFADHEGELKTKVREGRRQFLSQFRTICADDARGWLADPEAAEVFRRCKLDWAEPARHPEAVRLHADLLQLRHTDRTLRDAARLDGAVLGADSFLLRFFSASADDRLLLVNFGVEQYLNPAPEPLLAPVDAHGWRTLWSSEAPAYGGSGTPPLETTANWIIPGHAAVLLAPDPNPELPRAKTSEKD